MGLPLPPRSAVGTSKLLAISLGMPAELDVALSSTGLQQNRDNFSTQGVWKQSAAVIGISSTVACCNCAALTADKRRPIFTATISSLPRHGRWDMSCNDRHHD